MSQPTCATCRFFILAPGNTKWGVCRRFPAIPPRNKLDPADEWCGEHAPRPDEAGPGLPAGWVFATADHHTMARHDRLGVYCEAIGSERTVISTVGYIPDDVVLAVIAAHRARVGGAS